ncbi:MULTISPECIES: HAMP domain-containing sensor histidine kinase [unclassified Massilia]|uniref:sensor histidine kinase n=1 Tax=unclassified Massilia TaxID=2609279 RepID=UPI0017849332|nr:MULTISPECIES: HAMP domain-containing sensor histidine kinase [unclassified Massilia]MBD8530888.1 HAMP domain-containing histidine kinase [Massilia sp. CFBP 13647]MBD8674699.1 HAMP domain-containing histidine kinase [Massilia sp. CFBP 13721]
MQPADSLRRRIVVAFVAFGVVLSLFFAVLAAVAVEGIEVHLVDNRLNEVAKWSLPRQAAGLVVDLPAGLRFHRGDAIPLSLRGLPQGVSEIEVDGVGLHVLSGTDAHGAYAVVDHESDYEQVELVVYSMFAAFFIGFLVLAATLGGFIARRVVNPISELADAVARGHSPLPLQERKDELGILARALEAHTAELRAFLDRERFFTGDVSHELRSPLTVIMGAAEILMTNGANESTRAPAERIYRAAHEAAECVTVLLLLAREPELKRLAPVAVDAIAAREAERYRPLVANKPVTLGYRGGPAFAVQAPAELCAAAIGNLVRNACQYTEQGSVTVTLEPGRVVVEDTGPGLPDAVRATLAQPGAALGAIPSRGSAGTGLGLSLVRRICEYLGATLRYEERPGGGSRFIIAFDN